jgi:hypothetical protein
MKIIKSLLFGLALICFAQVTFAQNTNPTEFKGAVPTLDEYNALYVLNTSDPKQVKGTLRNIANVLGDPRLKGKLHVELVAFSDGVEVFKKDGPYQETLEALLAKGVILAQCENTIRARKGKLINQSYSISYLMYLLEMEK